MTGNVPKPCYLTTGSGIPLCDMGTLLDHLTDRTGMTIRCGYASERSAQQAATAIRKLGQKVNVVVGVCPNSIPDEEDD